nr:hypothetical protein [uncultured Allomuricauda sp.]
MKKTKFSHKVMAVFLTLTFLPSLVPVNFLFASNNGPNAPEAGSFEPVDATDMVNLVTGDLSYVLPLLNVPSPEGGYPLSLAYHAGIAMDQEASWVGLGWNLNPGAINRGVNGHPDDWGKTSFNEFFYDEGFQENYYSFSIGAGINNAVSVGLGASWGSNKSLGGFVSASVGFKETPLSVNARLGTGGTSSFGIGARYGNFNASIGTNGVGLNYGVKTGGNTTLGVGLNYNYSAGLSGSISSRTSTRTGAGSWGLGVNFTSKGASGNVSVDGRGAGVSTSTNGISSGDYDATVTTTSFSLPIYMFYIGYSHTKVKYSLFKNTFMNTSGMLYPVEANVLKPYSDGSGLSRLLEENYFMDVNVLPKYDVDRDVISLVEEANQLERNNLTLPNYDNYSVSGQGLSGSLKPYFYSELNLSARGRGEENDDDIYATYLNHDITEYNSAVSSGISVNRDAVKRIHFTMDNVYNSFLRVEKTNVVNPSLSDASIGENTVLQYFNTQDTGNFNNSSSLTSEYESRKREGNYIKTFTNKEIRDGQAVGLIEATGLSRQDSDTFLDKGIGAYQITTLDGKTYHYSLPVYNFETFYRNFRDSSAIPEDDKNFFEIQKSTPYATHWLLTAITGPDYVDNNNNGAPDESDYGYWVEFDYGKWSDGYVWQTPGEGYDENMDDAGNITYSYSWGRKQQYYLDAIKTRTHTALFVKDIRNDAKSIEKEIFNNRWVSGSFSTGDYFTGESYSKVVQSSKAKEFAKPNETMYTGSGGATVLPNTLNNCTVEYYSGLKQMRKYVEIPKNTSLKLKEIILLRNEGLNINKSIGNITPNLEGKLAQNFSYISVSAESYANGFPCGSFQPLFENEVEAKQFGINLHQNVLDVKDIEGLNLKNNAQQVIGFNHDYSLAQGSPNSEAIGNGRLTLNKVNFKGKKGIQLLPAYSFSYLNSNYNADNEGDWGYNRFYPQAWSLNNIETPTGGKIKIDYESDSYYTEAATYENKYFENISFVQTNTTSNTPGSMPVYEITFNDNTVLQDYFKVGKECGFTFKLCNYDKIFNTPLKVTQINNNKLTLIPTEHTETINYTSQRCVVNSNVVTVISEMKLKSNKYPHYTDLWNNGKEGGGVRVKSIQVSGDATSLTTEYEYTNPATNKISGITSYAPSKEDAKGIPYVSELPAPMVMYGHVKMVNKDANGTILGSSAYEFETLEPAQEQVGYIFSLGDAFKVEENQDVKFNSDKVVANKYTITSALGNLGRLLSVKSYNRFGHKLSEKSNSYKTRPSLNADGEIGVFQESHKSLKRINKKPVNSSSFVETFYVSSTSKVNYPSVLESSSEMQGNFTVTTHFDKHDFLTGQLLETTTENSEGLEFKTKMVPAYTKYVTMGSKNDNVNNKNMLLQEAASFTYLMDNGVEKAVNANITTWNNVWTYKNALGVETTPTASDEKVWRKHQSFIWDGEADVDGTYLGFNEVNDDDFQWGMGANQTNSKWEKVSEITKYDRNSAMLEALDINGNKSATKLGEGSAKVYAVGNAGHDEIFYSGAEDLNGSYFGGHVQMGTGDTTSIHAHTGKKSLQIKSSETGFVVSVKEGKTSEYKASLWVKKGATHANTRIVVGGNTISPKTNETIEAGDWVQMNFYFTINNTQNVHVKTLVGPIFVDDFRIHPINANVTSYVYNEWEELTHILGANNLATQFEYDDAGRLLKTYAEVVDGTSFTGGFKNTSEYKYNYKLVSEADDNGNGVVDGGEGYNPLNIDESVPNGYSAAGTLTILPTGGSGNYLYAFVQGEVTNIAEVTALTYGSYSANNQIYVSNIPCSGSSFGYHAQAVKVKVKDTTTGETDTGLYYYQKSCSSGGNGGGNNGGGTNHQ